MFKLTYFFILILALAGCVSSNKIPPNPCEQKRAAFDIGSGSTKVLLARVDFCQGRIVEKVWESSVPVAYQESLSKGAAFDDAVMAEGRAEFLRLLKEAVGRGAVRAGGVATHAFRKAQNGKDFLTELEGSATSVLPTRLKLITQDEELKLGYQAGVVTAGLQAKNVIVWDIGGGSQQMAARNPAKSDQMFTFKGDLASTRFMQSFPGDSPNPVGIEGLREGLLRARKEARSRVPWALRKLLREGATVVGVGGVLSKSVQGQVGKMTFTADEIDAVLQKSVLLSDAEIGGEYAKTQVTNLILVLGFMQELGIQQVMAVDANLAASILVSEEFWGMPAAAGR